MTDVLTRPFAPIRKSDAIQTNIEKFALKDL